MSSRSQTILRFLETIIQRTNAFVICEKVYTEMKESEEKIEFCLFPYETKK